MSFSIVARLENSRLSLDSWCWNNFGSGSVSDFESQLVLYAKRDTVNFVLKNVIFCKRHQTYAYYISNQSLQNDDSFGTNFRSRECPTMEKWPFKVAGFITFQTSIFFQCPQRSNHLPDEIAQRDQAIDTHVG